MNRAKYRGFSKDTGKWHCGSLVMNAFKKQPNGEPVPYIIQMGPTNCLMIEVIPESIEQFLGIYDANHKEIYEGDIIQSARAPYKKYSVIWDDYGMFLFMPLTPQDGKRAWDYCEIRDEYIDIYVIGTVRDADILERAQRFIE